MYEKTLSLHPFYGYKPNITIKIINKKCQLKLFAKN